MMHNAGVTKSRPMWLLRDHSEAVLKQERSPTPTLRSVSALGKQSRAVMMSSSLQWQQPKWHSSANNSSLLPSLSPQPHPPPWGLSCSSSFPPPAFTLPWNDLPSTFITFSLHYEATGVVFRSAEVIVGGWTFISGNKQPHLCSISSICLQITSWAPWIEVLEQVMEGGAAFIGSLQTGKRHCN